MKGIISLIIHTFINWIFAILEWVGLYTRRVNILLLGLDNSGKTTMLYILKSGKLTIHPPTVYPGSISIVNSYVYLIFEKFQLLHYFLYF
jgi:hypothetical protein